MQDYSLDICAFCSAPTWCYRTNKGPLCGACRVERFFKFVLYAPKGLTLMAWQRKVLRGLYGAADAETGEPNYWRAYWEVPKKNGKSFLIGGLPLYHLAVEQPERAEAYGCASAKDQAGIVFRAAAYLCDGNEWLKSKLKIIPSTKRIVQRGGPGFYSVISADGDLQDGIEPSLAIIDELHRWKTAKAHTLYEVVTKGTISRDRSMIVQITTAGDVSESPICWAEHQAARRILDGEEQRGRLYPMIFSADEGRVAKEPEYWKTREARVLANPSHEDNGGFLKDEKIAEEIEKGRATFLRYHLNIWGQKEGRWLESGEWARGDAETRSLLGRPVWLGLDLSSTTDFTALLLLFPDDSDASYDLLPFFWVPSLRVEKLERRLHIPLRRWIDRGLVTATDGDVVDYEAVEAKVNWASEDFQLQELDYDPWNATDLINRLTKAGHLCVKVPQTITHISAPMKHLHRKLLDGKIRHGGHEVLAWMANAVVARTDANGNISPRKPDLATDQYRIDGIAAALTALSRGMLQEEAAGPVEITYQ